MYFINMRLMSIIRINDGSTRENVATAEPRTHIAGSNPAFCMAVKPQ